MSAHLQRKTKMICTSKHIQCSKLEIDVINGKCSKNIEKVGKVKRPSHAADKRSAILKSQRAFVSLFRDINLGMCD